MQNIRVYAFSDEASPAIDDQIQALLRNDLNGMEIRNVDGVNIADITIDKAKEVKKKIDDSGLCVWSIGSPIGKIDIHDDFDSHLDKFKHTLEIAQQLDCANIRLFSFFMPKDSSPDIYREEVLTRLGRLVEAAKGYPVTLCHENEKGIFGDVPERCLEIHQRFPEIKAVFDPANFVQCGVDTWQAWELLKDYVHYIHIKDAMADGFIVPAGSGIGNIQKIAGAFIQRGGRCFTIEPHLAVFSGLEDLERADEKSKIRFNYTDNDTAFDVACKSFKDLL